MEVHHIGYAVRDIAKASKMFSELGFMAEGDDYLDVARGIHIRLLRNGATVVELVAPANHGSPIDQLLEKNGPSCYHLCFSTNNLEFEKSRLAMQKFKTIVDVEKAPALGDSSVVFRYNKDVGLIELVASDNEVQAIDKLGSQNYGCVS